MSGRPYTDISYVPFFSVWFIVLKAMSTTLLFNGETWTTNDGWLVLPFGIKVVAVPFNTRTLKSELTASMGPSSSAAETVHVITSLLRTGEL